MDKGQRSATSRAQATMTLPAANGQSAILQDVGTQAEIAVPMIATGAGATHLVVAAASKVAAVAVSRVAVPGPADPNGKATRNVAKTRSTRGTETAAVVTIVAGVDERLLMLMSKSRQMSGNPRFPAYWRWHGHRPWHRLPVLFVV